MSAYNFSRGLRNHREEKHWIWEFLGCGTALPNKVDIAQRDARAAKNPDMIFVKSFTQAYFLTT